jgi:hypothetical protein
MIMSRKMLQTKIPKGGNRSDSQKSVYNDRERRKQEMKEKRGEKRETKIIHTGPL